MLSFCSGGSMDNLPSEGSLRTYLAYLVIPNVAAQLAPILGVLPPRKAEFLTGLFGLLRCPAGIQRGGTRASKRPDRKETLQ